MVVYVLQFFVYAILLYLVIFAFRWARRKSKEWKIESLIASQNVEETTQMPDQDDEN